uniref:Hypothetical secreted protein n=1 Tax=Ornithodoros coriaceus TaxID=92741 RepID=B2D278_ORNCO|nr:hypothetical secreted protein precursor [Ornithodoros coriaceus]
MAYPRLCALAILLIFASFITLHSAEEGGCSAEECETSDDCGPRCICGGLNNGTMRCYYYGGEDYDYTNSTN